MTARRPVIYPVILSGGSGTRLWPLSRTKRPKQMLALGQERSMIAATARRVSGDGFAPAIVVAGEAHEHQVLEALADERLGALILEPAPRNTAPAIALAAHNALETDKDALILVMPSDHLIADEAAFHEAIATAVPLAQDGWLVTFGIEPDRAETGYGYVEAGEALTKGAHRAAQFHEKPEHERALAYFEAGGFYWNAGIFLMRAEAYLGALNRHAPDIAEGSEAAFKGMERRGTLLRPDAEAFRRTASQSIDYAVMEPEEKKAVVPVGMGWSDIGSFEALHGALVRDRNNNAAVGDVIANECSGTLIWAEDMLVTAVGVDDLAIVATPDAVMVLPLSRSQEAKTLVRALSEKGRREADEAPPARR